MQCSAMPLLCSGRVEVVVKHTFIEFRSVDEEDASQLRRNKSDPSFACAAHDRCCREIGKSAEPSELLTPTTCASLRGDDDDASSLGSPSTPDEHEAGQEGNRFCFSSSVIDELLDVPRAASLDATRSCALAWPQSCGTMAVLSTCPTTPPINVVPPADYTTAGNMYHQSSDCGAQMDETFDARTTLMVRNLPSDLSQPALVEHFLWAGYKGLFDFVYMPMNLREQGNFGYAFINFISPVIAVQVMMQLQSDDPSSSDRWTSNWSSCQGLDANVERYRNSPLMHELVSKECKPTMYDHSGNPVAFPKPTKTIPKPRIHWPSATGRKSSQGEPGSKGDSHADKSAAADVPERRVGPPKKGQGQAMQANRAPTKLRASPC